jgi:hypothetical protein
MNQPALQATIKAPAPRVFYLAMDDLYESQIAKAWAKDKGKSVVHFIPLERLTLEMVIVPIVRTAETRTPMLQEDWNQGEQRKVSKRIPATELVPELVECKPVRVGDFWQSAGGNGRHADGFSDLLMGSLDKNAFINAINESTAEHGVYPRTHHGDDNKTVKLTWGA